MVKIWRQFADSSTQFKLIFLSVLLVWMLALGGVVTLVAVAWERQAVAQPPVQQLSNPGQPIITLTPASGPVNTPVTISGENWRAGSTILFYLNPARERSAYDFALDSVVVDPAGRFEVTLTMPAMTTWPVPSQIRVTARPSDSPVGAEAIFSLVEMAVPAALPVQAATSTPVPAPTASPLPGIPQLTATTDLNIRGGPGTDYPILGLLKERQSAEVTGRSLNGAWWQIRFPAAADNFGWVNSQYVSAQHVADIAVVHPTPLPVIDPIATTVPQPTPSPLVITDWRGEYYNNPNMSGTPVLVRNDVDIDFNWSSGTPGPNLPAENFSVRWNRALYFPAGNYRFTVRADDGVMFWVDDRLLIDEWRDTSAATYQASVTLADGMHTLKLAYYERTGTALIQLRWEGINSFPDWKAEYFDNPNLSGSPVLIRNDNNVDFDWGRGAPASPLPADNFSVRWSRNLYFAAGTYRISLTADDGVRLWLDNRLVVDQWRDSSLTTHVVEVSLPEGERSVRLEYYERQGGAAIRLNWSRVESYPDWKAEYFDNRHLQESPVLVRNDHTIDFNWGKSAPASGLPADNFSVRWSRNLDLPAGTYLIKAKVDDGLRIWLDDTRVIDSWQDGHLRQLEAIQKISGGQHRIKVEYYDRSGQAQVQVSWQTAPPPAANQPPRAILPEHYQGSEGSPLQFDGRTSFDVDGILTRYEWDFDYDGRSFNVGATGSTPTHIYPDGPATHTVALRVSDDNGATSLATASVSVQNLLPVVQPGGPYSGLAGQLIALSGVAVDPATVDQTSLIYEWDLGDGNQASGSIISHVYTTPGTYLARLTVTDKDGGQQSASATVTVTAPNHPPQAVISGPASALIGDPVTLSGAGSNDPDGTIVSYNWDIGGDVFTGPEVTTVFTAAGSYPVLLTVVDDRDHNATARYVIEVSDGASEPPVEIPENLPLQ